MNVSDFKSNTLERLEQFNSLLEHRYGLRIDWEAPEDHLRFVYNHYMERKRHLKEHSSAEMSKIVLITEAIRIYMSEIAPTRKLKSRRK